MTGGAGSFLLAAPAFTQQLFAAGDDLLALPAQVSVETDAGLLKLAPRQGRTQWQGRGVLVEFERGKTAQTVFVTGEKTGLRQVVVRWPLKLPTQAQYLADHWERTYGDVGWQGMNEFPIRPWYFMVYDGHQTTGFGVKTGPASLCSWHVTPAALQLTLDVRNGAGGVLLNGRRLLAAELVTRRGPAGEDPFAATQQFCRQLCERPRLTRQPAYGINDWYYAYGNNSDEKTIRNCIYFADLVTHPENRPYAVIDGGWARPEKPGSDYASMSFDQLRPDESRFKDMGKLAARIKLEGFRPGIWIRPLWALATDPDSLTLAPKGGRTENTPQRILDPTLPESQARIASYFTKAIDEWGYEMVKHDYTSYDLFGRWGFEMLQQGLTPGGWHFHDQSKTSAEIVLDAYRVMRQASGDAPLIGCNTFGHLAAGVFELQRTGDDTSGREWARTRKMGVNTLAFRLPQHRTFYELDADCVGLTTEVPWPLNRQWLDLLARSGTATFVSASTDALVPEVRQAIKAAFARAAVVQPPAEPVDWLTSLTPSTWKFGTETVTYDWNNS